MVVNNEIEAKKKVADQIDSGEIVNMKSALAFDESLYCKRCGEEFSLVDGAYEGEHPEFKEIKAFGIMCPNCQLVNVAYYKTAKLFRLESKIDKAQSTKQRDKAIKKYQREFIRVQKRYGDI